MKKNKHIVSEVIPGGIAEEMEIEPGDEIVFLIIMMIMVLLFILTL